MTSRRLGARDDSAAIDRDGRSRPADELVSDSSGHRTPSLVGDGVLQRPPVEQAADAFAVVLRRGNQGKGILDVAALADPQC